MADYKRVDATESTCFKITEKEKAMLHEFRKETGMPMSEFLRRAIVTFHKLWKDGAITL